MRTMLVALLLAGAALAAFPSVSAAQELPVGCNAEVGACVWWDTPNGDCAGVHFGLQGAGACASSETGGVRACSSVRSALWEGSCPTDAVNAAISLPDVTCNPDFAGPCVALHSNGACVGVNFGLQGASVCATTTDGIRVCSSLRSALWDGFCPTDEIGQLIRLD